jgi:hypothetical protein
MIRGSILQLLSSLEGVLESKRNERLSHIRQVSRFGRKRDSRIPRDPLRVLEYLLYLPVI